MTPINTRRNLSTPIDTHRHSGTHKRPTTVAELAVLAGWVSLAEYRWLSTEISCWELVPSTAPVLNIWLNLFEFSRTSRSRFSSWQEISRHVSRWRDETFFKRDEIHVSTRRDISRLVGITRPSTWRFGWWRSAQLMQWKIPRARAHRDAPYLLVVSWALFHCEKFSVPSHSARSRSAHQPSSPAFLPDSFSTVEKLSV